MPSGFVPQVFAAWLKALKQASERMVGSRVIFWRITQQRLAYRLGMSRRIVSEVLNERRSVTTDMAHSLARVFDTTPDLWINMQTALDLWDALEANQGQYERIKPLKVA